MPEDKKDNFTFSDKIKNSKPGLSPFSKRVSSKVGNNGKPKKTLFERTKRDAPFFIAAAAALLMLPVLYKYSGQVNDQPIVPPQEGSIFDPERYGFDTLSGDPDGQIAQLSGRDPLSLIKGWGTPTEPEPYDPYDPSRDALDSAPYPAPSGSSTVNTIRNAAPAQTREAFQRSETKINPLGSAAMATGRGNSPNVGRWGGSLKNTARRQSAYEPPVATKPVSLQPLRPSSSSRSYFGQGGAAEARRSAQAATKGNALQALMDAQMRQVDPARVGGLGFGGGPGGGGAGGTLKRDASFTPIVPWWWDLMKTRAQKEWELWFDQKAKLVNTFGDFLQNALMCLLSGNEDNDVGTFFGTKASEAGPNKCCGLTEQDWKPGTYGLDKFPASKTICRGLDCYHNLEKAGKKGWEGGAAASPGLNFVEQRLWCLSNGLFGGGKYSGTPDLVETSKGGQCADMPTRYKIRPHGKAMKWNRYHYIVARNYSPIDGENNLCARTTPLVFNRNVASGAGSKAYDGTFGGTVQDRMALNEERGNNVASNKLINNKKSKNQPKGSIGAIKNEGASKQPVTAIGGNNELRNYEQQDVDSEADADGCVIYVAQGDVFEWTVFKKEMVNRFKEILTLDGQVNPVLAKRVLDNAAGYNSNIKPSEVATYDLTSLAELAFNHLDLKFIESAAMKHPLTNRRDNRRGNVIPTNLLPMNFYEFDQAYIEKRGATGDIEAGRRQEIDKLKYREEGSDFVRGARCDFHNIKLFCYNNNYNPLTNSYDKKPTAHLIFTGAFQADWEDINIYAQFRPYGGTSKKNKDGEEIAVPFEPTPMQQVILNVKDVYNKARTNTTRQPVGSERSGTIVFEGFGTGPTDKMANTPGTIIWTLNRTNTEPLVAACDVNASGDAEVLITETEEVPAIKTPEVKPAELAADGVALKEVIHPPLCDKIHHYRYQQGEGAGSKIVTANGTFQQIFAHVKLHCESCQVFVAEMVKKAVDGGYLDGTQGRKGSDLLLKDFVWALNVANQYGQGVPAVDVCLIGRQMALMSTDPQFPEMKNEFGAFAAYINPEASFFPSRLFKEDGGPATPDKRFTGCAGNGNAVNPPYGAGPRYHWGRYNVGRNGNANYRKLHEASAGAKKYGAYPLSKLAIFPVAGNTANQKRQSYHSKYVPFIAGNSCQAMFGSGNLKLPALDVQHYFDAVCENGLNYKPENGNPSCVGGKPGSTATTDVCTPGSDQPC